MDMLGMGLPQQSAAPFQMIPAELLAQIAARNFRPPSGMGAPQAGGSPGLPGMAAPSGNDLGAGMAGLGAGLAAYKKAGGNPFMAAERTAGDADLGGWNSGVDPMSGNPSAQPVEVFNPAGGATPGIFGGFKSLLRGLF